MLTDTVPASAADVVQQSVLAVQVALTVSQGASPTKIVGATARSRFRLEPLAQISKPPSVEPDVDENVSTLRDALVARN